MGAWGPGYFEDDTALDALDELVSAEEPVEYMRQAFVNVSGAEYVEFDLAQRAVVAAVVLDALLQGPDLVRDEDELISWLEEKKGIEVAPLRSLAVPALKKVLSDESELKELWEENEELFPIWKGGIELITGRLAGG